jgi:hypothetical protein
MESAGLGRLYRLTGSLHPRSVTSERYQRAAQYFGRCETTHRRVLDRSPRRLRGAEPLQSRQGFQALAPGADRWEIWVHRLRFRREAESVDDRQHEKVREAQLAAQQEFAAILELAFEYLETDLDFGIACAATFSSDGMSSCGFSFKIAGDWPQDLPAAGRTPCRTVIHQIKQDSFKGGNSCNASPFLKIEARPLGKDVRFFAQVAAGAPCAQPPTVMRAQICRRDLPRESWTTVQVRLNPADDASGRVDIWLNGAFCGAYQGPMADRDYGARRNGAPFINAQPRFGIYRDWRAETQTIYFDRIMFWNADPAGNPDWSVSPPPG